jgi:hypothetical protein
MQQRLKPARRTAWAQIISAELLYEFLFAAHNSGTLFDVGFGRETLAALTTALERRSGCCSRRFAWQAS